MCGIFFITKNDSKLSYSNDNDIILSHFLKGENRGPDSSSFYEINNCFIGFHRLAINGLDYISNQPFVRDGIHVMCNGEIYNYKQLYYNLGITPKTNSDCEIILDLYLKFPVDYFIKLLDGVFSFVIYDSLKQKTITGRDPFGVRPLFCNLNYTCFSSELKQLTFLPDKLIQFPPGHYSINGKLFKYFNIGNLIIPNYYTDITYYHSLIKYTLIESVNKRLLTERPIACLLSGGLDSSLITSIVCKLYNRKIETYAIGLPGSTDLIYAKKVADYIGTNHTEIIVTEEEFFNSIPEVIKVIESFDTTTVRASVGNYLVAKYISEHSEAKVIFNGDGSDELSGGYLYFANAPNKLAFDFEVHELLNNIHCFDVLRSDRCVSSCGLEPRTPFLDKTFVSMYLGIPIDIRFTKGNIEKKLIRDSFKGYLPDEILYRKKEAFSDGVSSENRSWFTIIAERVEHLQFKFPEINKASHILPKTKEQEYYRYLFEKEYPGRSDIIPYFWMPKWSNTTDPSARTLASPSLTY